MAGGHIVVDAGSAGKLADSKPKVTPFVYYLSFMAVIGGFLFGYDTGVVSSAMLFIPDAMNLNYTWTELIVSVTLASCAVFSLLAGVSNDYFGRRITILIASALFTVGSIVIGAAQNKEMLLSGRIVIGAAVGLASMTVPTYVGEACPAHLRGLMVTCFQFMITLGFFLASVLGGAFSYVDPVHIGWRLMVGIAAIPSLIQFVGFLFLPESPRWLATHGREAEAEKVLQRVYGNNQEWIDFEMSEIRQSHHKLLKERERIGGGWTIVQMLKMPHTRKALLLGCALQGFQQLSGVNTLMFYTATIIKMSGISNASTAIWMSCAVTGVNVICTFIPIVLVERLGRRKLLLGSMLGVASSLVLLGVGFYLIHQSAPTVNPYTGPVSQSALNDFKQCSQYSNCDSCVTMEGCGFCFSTHHNSSSKYGYCLPAAIGDSSDSEIGPCAKNSNATGFEWEWNFCPSSYGWIPILGMVCYLCAFSTGLAPMPWVMNAEIYPYWARSTGIACATATNWIFNLIISQTFLNLTEALSKYGTFFLYACVVVTAFIIFFFTVPETKGIRIEQVETLFEGKKNNRNAVYSVPPSYKLKENPM